jgi:signal peptidase I
MKKSLLFIWEIAKMVIIASAIVVPIRYFLFQPFIVKGDSMVPNFHENDYLIIDEISYRFQAPQRGDVIVFRYPKNPSQRFIKRIIGLPKETVEINDGQIFIYTVDGATLILNEADYLSNPIKDGNKLKTELGDNEYFVLGDNRNFSSDSRRWGALPRENIIGKVFLRVFPIAALARFETPTY